MFKKLFDKFFEKKNYVEEEPYCWCTCDCGNEVYTRFDYLRDGKIENCGHCGHHFDDTIYIEVCDCCGKVTYAFEKEIEEAIECGTPVKMRPSLI